MPRSEPRRDSQLDSVTQILRSDPPGTKVNIAVVGDGFAAGDQAAYNAEVQDLIIDGVFGHDYFYEDASRSTSTGSTSSRTTPA